MDSGNHFSLTSTDKKQDRSWILDTGASGHFTYSKEYMHGFVEDYSDSNVTVASGQRLNIAGWGSITFRINKNVLIPMLPSENKPDGDDDLPKLGENFQDGDALIHISQVGYVPEMSVNLISTMQLGRQTGFKVTIEAFRASLTTADDDLIMTCFWIGHSYLMPIEPVPVAIAKKLQPAQYLACAHLDSTQRDILLWHRRLGHVGITSLRKIQTSVDGLPDSLKKTVHMPACTPCALSRRQRMTFGRSEYIATTPLELVHCDLSGPFVATADGFRYFAVFVDDFSRFVWVFLLRTRQQEELVNVIKAFVAKAQVDVAGGHRVANLHSDNEFNVPSLNSWCRDHQIHQSFITPVTPQHNSRAERIMRTIKEPAGALLGAAGLPKTLWSFAVLTAAHVRNRVGHRSLNNVSPYEKLKGHRPDLRYLRVFGCLAFPMLQASQRGPAPGTNWADKGRAGVFVGYSTIRPGYLIWFPDTGQVATAVEVIFDEESIWKWDPPHEFRKTLEKQGYDLWDDDDMDGRPRPSVVPRDIPRPTRFAEDPETVDRGYQPLPPEEMRNRPSSSLIPEIPESVGSLEGYGRTRSRTRDISTQPSLPPRDTSDASANLTSFLNKGWMVPESILFSFLTCPMAKDPNYFDTVCTTAMAITSPAVIAFGALTTPERYEQSALRNLRRPNTLCSLDRETVKLSDLRRRDDWPEWEAAMKKEWNSLTTRNTFEAIETLPAGKNVVGHKWVLVTKRDIHGKIVRHKARFVAQGFSQVYGIDYTETFSPTLGLETLRIMFTLAVQEGYHWRLLDVSMC
ncbi:unnamed protein product [Parajaminaea phylloscopi]